MQVTVVGAGAWGTALAKLLAEKGDTVRLWCREEPVRDSILTARVNRLFLPDIPLPDTLEPTTDLAEACAAAQLVVLAVPSQFLRGVVESLADILDEDLLLVSATKGIEEGTLLRMSELVFDVLSPATRFVAISGPTFAKEVAKGQPTALVAASAREDDAKLVQTRLSTDRLRVYASGDVVSVELGGSLKNVIALAVGVASGLGLGYNPAAALIARGLAEMSRLAEAMGGTRETLLGLSGVGDLVLTCTGALSRNRTVGVALGEGKSLQEILSSMPQVVEGVGTTHAAVELAARHDVEVPIMWHMERVLVGDMTPAEAMKALMARPLRAEF